jgi:hypothetical protein
MNSREKGKRGERAWRDELRANGYDARRGQQFSGSPDSPDVICPALPWIHFEVKCVERLNIEDAMAQARRDAQQKHRTANIEHRTPNGELAEREKIPVVAHKRNFCGWLVTMDAETFFKFLRGDLLEPRMDTDGHGFSQPQKSAKNTEENLGVSGEAHDTTRETRGLPENKNNNQSAL